MEMIFIPAPGMGHLVSAVELAKLLLQKKSNLSVSVLIMKLPFESQINSYADSLMASDNEGSRLKFIQLTSDQNSPAAAGNNDDLKTEHASGISFFRGLIESHKPKVKETVNEIKRRRLKGIVVDILCTTLVDDVGEFEVPTYVFYPSGAAMLGLQFHVQSLTDDKGLDLAEIKDSDPDIRIPTYPAPFPTKFLPSIMRDKSSGGLDMFLDVARLMRKARGILVNTFLELEPHALEVLSRDESVPPVLPVGPILNLAGRPEEERETLEWLDGQPDSSVVFLCFGSGGSFPESQVEEIAHALENSKHRFLWALRKPSRNGALFPTDYDNLEQVLPDGFLERTKTVGKIIGWAPQTAVLAHPALGGFVSHCGWNSILESLWFGVPIAAWPMYAEQQSNAFQLVMDIGVGVEIKMDYVVKDPIVMMSIKEGDDVTADEIETGIRSLMDRSAANPLRIRAKELKENSRKALEEGGSSFGSLERFFELVFSGTK